MLSVDAFNGLAADYYNDQANQNVPRTGAASWVPVTDATGSPFPGVTDPFRNDPRINSDTRGGRIAADDVGGTPYGRPRGYGSGRARKWK